MKLCLKILAIAVIAATTYSLTGCAAPASFSYSNVGVTLSQTCSDCVGGAVNGVNIVFDPNQPGVMEFPNAGQGGTVLFTATVTNAPSNVTWALYPTSNLIDPNPPANGTGLPVGEKSPAGATGYLIVQSGNTATYTNSGASVATTNITVSIPIYYNAALTQAQNMQYVISYTKQVVSGAGVTSLETVNVPTTGIPQGDVLLEASVPNNPDNPSSVAAAYQLLEWFNENNATPTLYMAPQTPTVPSGLTDSVLTVPRITSYQFYGGVAGSPPCAAPSVGALCANGLPNHGIDNTPVWEVGNAGTASGCPATAVAGGTAAYGTITTTGLFTAPAVIPPGFSCVVLAAHSLPTTTATAYITID
jgi:hypothetical protein